MAGPPKRRSALLAALGDAFRTDVLEEPGDPLPSEPEGITISLGGFEIAGSERFPADSDGRLFPSRANSVRGPSPHSRSSPPTGCTTRERRRLATSRSRSASRRGVCGASGPFSVDVAVASERTDVPVAGEVELRLPPGWSAEPAQRMFRLAPGAHLRVFGRDHAGRRLVAGALLRGSPHRGRGRTDPRGHRDRGIPARGVGFTAPENEAT